MQYVKVKWNAEVPTRVCTSHGSEKVDVKAGGIVEIEVEKAKEISKMDKRFEIQFSGDKELQKELKEANKRIKELEEGKEKDLKPEDKPEDNDIESKIKKAVPKKGKIKKG